MTTAEEADAAEDAVYKALLMLLQRAPLSLHIAEQFIRWLEQDGFTVTRRPDEPLTPEVLANIIREVDGNHDLGAGELAERILDALRTPTPAESGLREALEVISEGRHPDGHRGAVLVARAALAARLEGEP